MGLRVVQMVKRISGYWAFGLLMAISGGVCVGVVRVCFGFCGYSGGLEMWLQGLFSVRIKCFVFCWPAVSGQ